MNDTDFIKRLVSGKFQNSCRLCLRELQGAEAASLHNVLATLESEVTLEEHLNLMFPELQLMSCITDGLSKKICITCLKEVKFGQYRPQNQPNLIALEHYTEEIYAFLLNLNDEAIADDAMVAIIRVRPVQTHVKLENVPKANKSLKQDDDFIYFDIKHIKKEPSDFVTIKEQETDEFDDTLLIVGEKESTVPSGRLNAFYHKKFNPADVRGEKLRAVQLLKYARQKAPPIQCKMCLKKYSTIKWLVQHGLIAHGIIVCEECGSKFEDENKYKSHVEEHADVYSCDLCGRGFKFRHSIVVHMLKHEREKWQACVCEACGARLWDRTSLEVHVRRAHGGRSRPRLTCCRCGRMYRVAASLEAHLARHDSARESATCEECGSTFTSADSLAQHMQLAHGALSTDTNGVGEAEKIRYPCRTCGGTFVDARSLRWHERLHTGERPYHCAECGRDFVSRYRRNQHALTAHTAPRRQCPLCPALFHLNSMVNTHIKKVHLKEHKRQCRVKRRGEPDWPTEKVPFSDLSVHVQTQLLQRTVV